VAGAVAAILVATARRAHAGTPLLVRGAGAAKSLAVALGGDVVVGSFTVLLDDDAYLARAAVPRAQALRVPPHPWSRAALAALGDTPLRLPVVAAATLAAAADVASLRVGDAWLPGAWLAGGPGKLPLHGDVALAAQGASDGLLATLGEDGRLVLRGQRVELAMQDDQTVNEAVGQALGDVPVVVRVEIGQAELPAREWAALDKGDVIALGTKIAEPVVLRVGGVEVARGELVEIEGEVGVRILSRRDAAGNE
jgi:flagellar motor switch/type III secretory pathway protein FliN